MTRKLAEGGASYDITNRGGSGNGVMLDDLLLGADWNRTCRRTALRTCKGEKETEDSGLGRLWFI